MSRSERKATAPGASLGGYWPPSSPMRALSKGQNGHTTAQALQVVLSANEPAPSEVEVAAAQQENVREQLAKWLRLVITFLTGSYRRHTQRRPVEDIDMLVVLERAAYLPNGSVFDLTPALAEQIVTLVERMLKKAFPRTEIVRFNRGVQIKFSASGIVFDVVPCFQFSDDVFYIPDTDLSSGSWGWLKTNPKEQQRLMTEENAQCGGMLVPLVKLLKAAYAEAGKPGKLSGFHLEAITYHALQHEPSSYAHGLQYLFEQLAVRVFGTTEDIWPEGERVGRNVTPAQQMAAYQFFANAASAAVRANSADDDGRADDAHAEWFALFGDVYPETGVKRDNPVLLSAREALNATRSGSRVAATSSGLIAVAAGWSSARSGTTHGAAEPSLAPTSTQEAGVDAVSDASPEPIAEDTARLERDIEGALRQFTALERLTPEAAAQDPTLWPVTSEWAKDLYAVLIGEQRTNQGTSYRILVAIPRRTPALEPRIYLLTDGPRAVGVWAGKRRRGQPHRWRDGALCTHAARDRWDGRLVTLLIWAADYLVRYDHFQRTGFWVGREIDGDGRFRLNGRRRVPTRSRARRP